jgi:hypothetical protein
MAAFLREILMTPTPAAALIEADLAKCLEMHFAEMPGLLPAQPGALSLDMLERLQPVVHYTG